MTEGEERKEQEDTDKMWCLVLMKSDKYVVQDSQGQVSSVASSKLNNTDMMYTDAHTSVLADIFQVIYL